MRGARAGFQIDGPLELGDGVVGEAAIGQEGTTQLVVRRGVATMILHGLAEVDRAGSARLGGSILGMASSQERGGR